MTFSTGPGLAPADVTTHQYLEKVSVDIARQLADGTMSLPDRSSRGMVQRLTDWVLSFEMVKDYVFKVSKTGRRYFALKLVGETKMLSCLAVSKRKGDGSN